MTMGELSGKVLGTLPWWPGLTHHNEGQRDPQVQRNIYSEHLQRSIYCHVFTAIYLLYIRHLLQNIHLDMSNEYMYVSLSKRLLGAIPGGKFFFFGFFF